MEYRKLGSSDLEVSAIGFGAWGIGGAPFWKDEGNDPSCKSIQKAYDLGINFFDTADFYGFGHSEELIGNLWGNRNDIIVATKVGQRMDADNNIYPDYSKDYVVKACEASLKRLKREFK